MPFDPSREYFKVLNIKTERELNDANKIRKTYLQKKSKLEKEKSVARYQMLIKAYRVLSHPKTRKFYLDGKLDDSEKKICLNVKKGLTEKEVKSSMMFNGTEPTPRGLGVCEMFAEKGQEEVGKDGFKYRLIHIQSEKKKKIVKKWKKIAPKKVGETYFNQTRKATFVGKKVGETLKWVIQKPKKSAVTETESTLLSPTKEFNYYPTPKRQQILSGYRREQEERSTPLKKKNIIRKAQTTPATPKTPPTPKPKKDLKLNYLFKVKGFVSGLTIFSPTQEQNTIEFDQIEDIIDTQYGEYEDKLQTKKNEFESIIKYLEDGKEFKQDLMSKFAKIFNVNKRDKVFDIKIYKNNDETYGYNVELQLDPENIRYFDYFKPVLRSRTKLKYDKIEKIKIMIPSRKIEIMDKKTPTTYNVGIAYFKESEDEDTTIPFSFDD